MHLLLDVCSAKLNCSNGKFYVTRHVKGAHVTMTKPHYYLLWHVSTGDIVVLRKPLCSQWLCIFNSTYNSMALFQLMTYPESTKDSMLTICTFPLSVPMYNHLLWNGRSHCVILKDKNNMVICSDHTISVTGHFNVQRTIKLLFEINVSSNYWIRRNYRATLA